MYTNIYYLSSSIAKRKTILYYTLAFTVSTKMFTNSFAFRSLFSFLILKSKEFYHFIAL